MTNTPMTFEQFWDMERARVQEGRHDTKTACELAWQASQAQQASEIEALKHDLYSYMEASNGYVNEIMKQDQTIAELVEALNAIEFQTRDNNIKAREIAKEAIAKAKGK